MRSALTESDEEAIVARERQTRDLTTVVTQQLLARHLLQTPQHDVALDGRGDGAAAGAGAAGRRRQDEAVVLQRQRRDLVVVAEQVLLRAAVQVLHHDDRARRVRE